MNGIEIKKAAENYIDEFIDDPEAVTAINRALNLIGDTALIYEQAEADIPRAREWFPLPDSVTNIREVEDQNGKSYEHFRVRENLISFDHPGMYTIHYRRLPRPIGGIYDTPEVHPAFHQVLVTYVIAWWKLKDDDSNPDGIRHMEQFKEDTMRVFGTLRRQRGPKKVTVRR